MGADRSRDERQRPRRVPPGRPAKRTELGLRSGLEGVLVVVAAAAALALSAWLLAAGMALVLTSTA